MIETTICLDNKFAKPPRAGEIPVEKREPARP
jgi:hypothetical protein